MILALKQSYGASDSTQGRAFVLHMQGKDLIHGIYMVSWKQPAVIPEYKVKSKPRPPLDVTTEHNNHNHNYNYHHHQYHQTLSHSTILTRTLRPLCWGEAAAWPRSPPHPTP